MTGSNSHTANEHQNIVQRLLQRWDLSLPGSTQADSTIGQKPIAQIPDAKSPSPFNVVNKEDVGHDEATKSIPPASLPLSEQTAPDKSVPPYVAKSFPQINISAVQPIQIAVEKNIDAKEPVQQALPPVMAQRSTLSNLPLSITSRSTFVNTSSTELFDDPEPMIGLNDNLTAKDMVYKNRMMTLIPLEPLSLNYAALQLTELSEFIVVPVYPRPQTTISQAGECIPIIWSPVPLPRVGYYLEISRDNKFRYVKSYGSDTNQLALKLNDSAQDYYWRVRAVLGDESLLSALTSFHVNKDTSKNRTFNEKDKSQLPEWEVCYVD